MGRAQIYDAVAEIARRCLVEDGSLFVPGESTWTLDGAELLGSRVGQDQPSGPRSSTS